MANRPPSSDHRVQLFDSDESLADALTEFLSEGRARNAGLLVAITRRNWAATARRLKGAGFPISESLAGGRLTVMDAQQLLKQFAGNGHIDAALFDRTVGSLIRRLAADGPLYVFGEMVDLLAGAGDYRAAERLEVLWNGLAERASFTLFCGYSSVSFGDVRSSGALRQICAAHSHVQLSDRDRLGSWLVSSSGANL